MTKELHASYVRQWLNLSVTSQTIDSGGSEGMLDILDTKYNRKGIVGEYKDNKCDDMLQAQETDVG